MKKYLLTAAAAVAAGALIVPAAAQGARVPGHEGGFVALSKVGGGRAVPPGAVVPVTIGVAYNGNVSPEGVLLKVRAPGGLELPRTFGNCWYFVDSGTEGAWCKFDRTLEMGIPYALSPFTVRAQSSGRIAFEWRGVGPDGIKALAEQDARPGTTPVKGAGPALTLKRTGKLVLKDGPPTGFADVRVVKPAPATPTRTTPTTATPAAAATTAPPASASGGSLPITGSNAAAVAGAGVLLMLAGAVGWLVARRRTRFDA